MYDHIVLLYCFGKGKSRRTIPQDWIYPVKDIEDFSQYPAADQYMLSIELIRKDRVDQIHSLGKKVTAWTVNDLYSLRKCESAQVDDMITDDPGGLLKLDDQ